MQNLATYLEDSQILQYEHAHPVFLPLDCRKHYAAATLQIALQAKLPNVPERARQVPIDAD